MKTWTLVFVLTLASVASEALAADEIHWTIIGQDPVTFDYSVTFDWRGTATENFLTYGSSPGVLDHTVIADTPSPLPTSSSGPFWEAKISGLQENTLYYYAIGGGPEHTFITPPPRGSSDFIVYAVGDIGSSLSYSRVAPVQKLIGDVYGNGFPDFALLVGDLSYGDLNGAADVDQHFNDVMVWARDAAYMPAWGNHEWHTSTSPDQLNNYEGRFALPNSQSSPGTSAIIGNGPGEDWYWFDYGNIRFIAYPEPYSGAWSDWNTQAQALMDAAQADPALKYIVTFGHRPAYAESSASSELKTILDGLGDGHSKYVLNLCGHSHTYQRSFPQHGVVHVVVGTGHASPSTFSSTQPSWSAFRTIQSGALKLRFTDASIEGEFICAPADSVCPAAGFVKDSFAIAFTVTGNLLLNPDFELDANNDTLPDSWTSDSHFTRSSEVVHGGSFAGKHSSIIDIDYIISQTVNSLTAGTTYNFSGWVNIPPANDKFEFRLEVQWLNVNNQVISTKLIKRYKAATSGWGNATASLVAPAGTTKAVVRMVVKSLKRTVYVDDFVFQP